MKKIKNAVYEMADLPAAFAAAVITSMVILVCVFMVGFGGQLSIHAEDSVESEKEFFYVAEKETEKETAASAVPVETQTVTDCKPIFFAVTEGTPEPAATRVAAINDSNQVSECEIAETESEDDYDTDNEFCTMNDITITTDARHEWVEEIAALVGATIIDDTFGDLGIYVLHFSENLTPEEMEEKSERLLRLPNIVYTGRKFATIEYREISKEEF